MLLFGCVRKACTAVSEVKLSQTCPCAVVLLCLSRAAERAQGCAERGEQGIPKAPRIPGPPEGAGQWAPCNVGGGALAGAPLHGNLSSGYSPSPGPALILGCSW